MKYFNILILGLLIIGCSEKRVLYSELKESGGLFYFQGEPFTGVAFDMFDETKFKFEKSIKSGKLYGKSKEYHKNGEVYEEGDYENGIKVGIWKSYHDNQQLAEEGKFVNGAKIGVWKSYHFNGKLASEGEYEDDIEVGRWKSYYDNGNLEGDFQYLDKEKRRAQFGGSHGSGPMQWRRLYHENGIIMLEEVILENEHLIEKRTDEDGYLIWETEKNAMGKIIYESKLYPYGKKE